MPGPPEALAPSETIAYVLADLAIILIAARIVGGLFVRFKQPRVVGEIIAGILIGPTVLGGQLAKGAVTALDKPAVDGSGLVNDLYPLQAFAFLNLMGLLALVFFMFLVGLEVQQRFLKGREKQILIVALAVLLIPIGLGFLISGFLDEPGKWKVVATPAGAPVSATTHALFLGAGLAVTAFPVMARILQEKRQIATPMGAIGVGAAAIVTPLMFLAVAGAAASAKGEGVPDTVGVKLALAAGLVALLFGVVRPALGWLIRKRFKEGQPLDGELLALLLIGALATGLAADRIGIHSLNGGFLFGAAVPQVAGLGKAVIDRVQQFVVVFMIPVFLAVSGLQTDLTTLGTEHIGGILIFLLAMVVGKWVVGAAAGLAVGLNFKEANAIGVLMNCRGLMILVVALVGKQAGVITDPMQGVFVIGAIVTTLMTGPLADIFMPKADVEEKRKETMAGSIAGLAAMTGGPRILVAPGSAAALAPTLARARELAPADGPAAQFLVAGLEPPTRDGDYVGAQLDAVEPGSVTWAQDAARLLAAEGADAAAVALASPDPSDDLPQLASEWAATEAVVAEDDDARALEAAGVRVHRLDVA
jgi:Kef-type K+ transport system membrane component KefB